MKDIDDILEVIDDNRASLDDPHVDEWVGEQLTDIRSRLLKYERDGAYQRFIRRFIDEEYSPDDHDGKPRCTCGNDCPILRRKLPAMVRGADEPAKAAEEWAVRHPGTPHALRAADDAHRQRLASIYSDAERVRTATDRERIPNTGAEADGEVTDVEA